MSELANKLRQLRAEHKMTLDDLSDQTGLTKSYLSEIERGRRATIDKAVSTLNKVLVCYGMEIVVEIRSKNG